MKTNTYWGSFLLFAIAAGSAIAAPGDHRPAAFDNARLARGDSVELRQMPAVNVAALKSEDARNIDLDGPRRFATALAVDIDPLKSGVWEDLDKNHVVWRLRIESKNARSLIWRAAINFLRSAKMTSRRSKNSVKLCGHNCVLGGL